MPERNSNTAAGHAGKPLHRRLIKLALTGVHGWSHAHNWLPGLRLMHDEPLGYSRVVYRGREVGVLNRPSILGADAGGAELFVIGSGPSVKTASFDDVGPSSAILLNGACMLIGESIVRPLAIAVEDERFIWRHFPLLREKTPVGTIALLSTGVMRAICEIDAGWLATVRPVLIDDIRKPYGRVRRTTAELRQIPQAVLDETNGVGFSTEPDIGVFQGGSVAISAIQFAAYCRPSQIGFIGIDIANADQPRFYEEQGRTAPSGIVRSQDRILKHVALARDVCGRQGIQMRSHSSISLLNQLF